MDLKVGDLVAFKKYENMTDEERGGISKCSFPKIGKVSHVHNEVKRFFVEGEPYAFNQGSIDYIIVKGATGKINVGDEVLIKTTVREVKGNLIWVSWVSKDDVVKVLKHKSERFIVKENYYGMYIGNERKLVCSKDAAQGYASRDAAYQEASDMHLNAYDVIPYGD